MSSLQPGLVPTLADLLQALRFAVVVSLTCGLGFMAGARRLETALFTGWGIACLVLVATGCLAQAGLAPATMVLALVGAAGLITRTWHARAAADGDAPPRIAPRILALATPLFLILLSLRTTAYDDFSFWAPNLIALCRSGHFPLAAQPLAASFMPAYPRGVALSGYATWLLHPDLSPAGIVRLLATGAWWNILLMLAVAAALANNLKARFQAQGVACGRHTLWAIAALAMLLQSFLNPGFISKMTLSNMGDGATGSGLAMLTALVFELPNAGRRAPRIITEMAFTAAALVFVRQDNFALIFIWASGAGLGVLRRGGARRLTEIFWLAVAALPALLVWLIWTHYTATQIPGGAHSLLPIQDWHWAAYHYTLNAAWRVLLSKGVYTLLAIGFGILFLTMLAGRGPQDRAGQLSLTATTVLIYGNAAFILFTYLATSFTPVEVRTAVTFWRFLAQTAPAEMVTLACLLPMPWLAGLRHRNAALPLCLIAAFLPAALLATPFTFRTDLRFPTPAFLGIGESLASLVPPGANILLIDNSDGSFYVGWMIKFGLLELAGAKNPVRISLRPQLAPGLQAGPATIPAGTYVVLTQSPWRPPYFLGLNLQPWHAYLLLSGPSGLIVLKDWPIPLYGRKY